MSIIVETLKKKDDLFSAKPATHEEVLNAEKELKLSLAEEYKEYLLSFGVASYFGHELTGICKSPRLNVVTVTKKKHEDYPSVPKDWYVIEDTNMDGILIWQNCAGEVFRTGSLADSVRIASSLCEYIGD